MAHEIRGHERSIEDLEIRILEAELQIERFKEQIESLKDVITTKTVDMEAAKKVQPNG
jgi:chaperonin cofactor prefoldin